MVEQPAGAVSSLQGYQLFAGSLSAADE